METEIQHQDGYRYEIERDQKDITIRVYEDPPQSPRARQMHLVCTLDRLFLGTEQRETTVIRLACERTRKELVEWLDLEIGRKKPESDYYARLVEAMCERQLERQRVHEES